MGIVDEDIARVRDATDMVALVSQYTAVKSTGHTTMALCPFHGEKTPSLSVSAEKGVYYCHGCQAQGDAITFVRNIETLDFAAAVELLAGRAGITLRYDKANESADRQHRTRLHEALGEAVDWYHDRLLTATDAGPARAYLRSRGFTSDEVRRYKLGWAPDTFDALSKALGVSDKVFTEAGLGFINRRRRQQDSMSFRSRLLFPIFDERDRAVGFGGRVLPGDEGAKYKNSNDSAVYNKSRVLYGLNWAREYSVNAGERGGGSRGELVICEGYTDVIGFARAGVPNAVATCGTSLTEDHVRLMKKFCSRVVLAFDADGAGFAAAEKFYQWEREHDLEVTVADLPEGVDPGSLAETDPERLRQSVDEPLPFLAFRVGRVLDREPLTNAETRARVAEQALVAIGEHPSDLVRDQYLHEVADRCRIDVDRLRAAANSPDVLRARSEQAATSAPDVIDLRDGPGSSTPRRARRNSPEAEALRLAIQRPEEIASWLAEELFSHERALVAYRALATAETFHQALESTDPETRALLTRLAVEQSDVEAIDVVCRLVDVQVREALTELETRSRHAADPLAVVSDLQMLKLERERLYELDEREEAAGRLLDWLRGTRGGIDG